MWRCTPKWGRGMPAEAALLADTCADPKFRDAVGGQGPEPGLQCGCAVVAETCMEDRARGWPVLILARPRGLASALAGASARACGRFGGLFATAFAAVLLRPARARRSAPREQVM